jgi:hypothetical protein
MNGTKGVGKPAPFGSQAIKGTSALAKTLPTGRFQRQNRIQQPVVAPPSTEPTMPAVAVVAGTPP